MYLTIFYLQLNKTHFASVKIVQTLLQYSNSVLFAKMGSWAVQITSKQNDAMDYVQTLLAKSSSGLVCLTQDKPTYTQYL